MMRRLVRVVVSVGIVAAVLPGASAHATPTGATTSLSVTRWFSPNGDGIKDVATVRFTLPKRQDRVTLTFRTGYSGYYDNVRRVVLKDLAAGPHTWTWDGRDGRKRRVDDAVFKVTLRGEEAVTASGRTQVDTTFAPSLAVATTYGAGDDTTPTIWPRSTAVTDSLTLVAHLNHRTYLVGSPVRDARLEIRDRTGRLVLTRDVDRRILNDRGREVDWSATRGGRALPKGRYTARVIGGDQVGNRGRSEPLRIWVSGDRLEWQERTEVVAPATSTAPDTCFSSGCGDFQPCGSVVPSARYVDGLSYRSVECTGQFRYSVAARTHYLPVADAVGVRGVAAAKVAFTGAPTTDGEADTGGLSLRTTYPAESPSVRSSTGGETAWSTSLEGGDGTDLREYDGTFVPPAVWWGFGTRGSDSVDVDRFTVTYRLLLPVRS